MTYADAQEVVVSVSMAFFHSIVIVGVVFAVALFFSALNRSI
jgi:hypothetical protein